MHDTVISVENLSKHYPSLRQAQYKRQAQDSAGSTRRIGSHTLRDDAARWWAKLRGQPDPTLKIGQTPVGSPHSAFRNLQSAILYVYLAFGRGWAVGIGFL